MSMQKSLRLSSVISLMAFVCMMPYQQSLGRGFQGGGARPNLGGGGGAASRPNLGGGGAAVSRPNLGGGGAAVSRPNVGSISRPNVPSMPAANARPSVPTSRPNVGGSAPSLGGVTRPNLPSQSRPPVGQNRPDIGSNFPSTDVSRPSFPDISNRPSVRPPGSLPSVNRPSIPDRPSLGNTRPALPDRPTTLPAVPDRPSLGGSRPSLPERPTTLPAFPDRPSLGGNNRPPLPERPTTLPALPDRPSLGGNNRPSLPERPSAGINRPAVPERPTTLPAPIDRPWLGGNNRPQIPDRPTIGGNRPNWPAQGGGGINIGNNNNNININWNNRVNWGMTPAWGWGPTWGWHGPNHWHNHWGNHVWFHGVWSGSWVNRWYRPPTAFFIGWGLGSWSGVNSFSNPYFVATPTAPFNYSQPIVINNFTSAATVDSGEPESQSQDSSNTAAMALFNDGLIAFKNAQYSEALSKFDSAVALLPGDAVLHELRALTYFALGNFQQSAAVLNSLLAATPGMDWTTMSGLYGNIDDYTTQLRTLEQHVSDNLNDAAASFVLAYHYLVTGHTDDAIELLQAVVALQPKDTTAQRLLKSLSPPPTPASNNTTTPSESDPPEIDLVGNWLAEPQGAKIRLAIDEMSGFVWNATPENQQQVELTGSLFSTGDSLILETEKQGSMVGDVTPMSPDKFRFQIPGGPPNDPGLTFIRQR